MLVSGSRYTDGRTVTMLISITDLLNFNLDDMGVKGRYGLRGYTDADM